MPDTENLLIQKAKNFNQATLGEIYDRYSPAIYRYAMRLLGDESLSEDCVAETFFRFLNALKNNKGPKEHLQAYLFRIAHNWITDQYRSQVPANVELRDDLCSDAVDLENQVEQNIRVQFTHKALSTLNKDQREIIILKYLEGYENYEIATIIGKNIGSVKALLHRATVTMSLKVSELEQENVRTKK
ncbi:MAG: hypothetical protein C0401_00320 [Anaerolinea sp.]|nr:hypothetical protein [Anaerolinea sp.]